MNILALSPHTDDAELGAGGTLARYVEEGHTVVVVAFGTGDANGASIDEYSAAMETLGIADWHLFDQFPARLYPNHRQEILDCLEDLRDEVQPDLVFCPSLHDTHQDHATIAMEAVRVFKCCASILAYEAMRNYVANPFWPTHFVKLEERHMQTKMEALACYASQAKRSHWASLMDSIQNQAQVHGMRIGTKFAEAFEGVRWIV
jgi:LmbE family N-acetylglucosaminyl deacetylase